MPSSGLCGHQAFVWCADIHPRKPLYACVLTELKKSSQPKKSRDKWIQQIILPALKQRTNANTLHGTL